MSDYPEYTRAVFQDAHGQKVLLMSNRDGSFYLSTEHGWDGVDIEVTAEELVDIAVALIQEVGERVPDVWDRVNAARFR